MPTYQWECQVCSHNFDVTCMIAELKGVERCPKCGSPASRVFVPVQVGGFKERTLELEGPGNRKGRVRISSVTQLKDECRKRGKIHTGYMYYDKE